ncbi:MULTISPECIES: ATP-binding protein [unclassified Frankia]|uniref:ATP-binding protein n=1 Tax=unclassified Frankia TaxID=2632575 RepID=UPI002AD5918B|nr:MULTISPECIES: ATP-binding protein [unclassified Frankia]
MSRRFQTAGPCRPGIDYMVPALSRLPEVPGLVDQEGYFVVHAPRQTGKTTTLQALADELTARGRYAAVLFSCEVGRVARDDYGRAARGVLQVIREAAEDALPPQLRPQPWPDAPDETLLGTALRAWAQACPRPLVLFFDEIDALQGQSLLSVLSQLRNGYRGRPSQFPASVALCGLRDVRDYKAAAGGDPSRLGTSSPFNIKLESLRLGDFTPDEVAELYGQHTADIGQEFTPAAVARAYELTAGQPWLVNALAREIVVKLAVPASAPITIDHLEQAKERLILARATHLDSLAARLAEPRVRRIVQPLLAGDLIQLDPYDDDLAYTRDLGLIAPKNPVRIANPIYREVIVRVLTSQVEANVVADPRSFVRSDGRFDFQMLLREFAEFWIEHGDVLTSTEHYHEVAPQLVLMGFLQRVVNGGGYVEREYGVGAGRIDLLVQWPYTDQGGKRRWQREALELKVWHPGKANPLRQGLTQLDRYLDRIGLDAGTLILFDRRPGAADITERTQFDTVTTPTGRAVTLLRA